MPLVDGAGTAIRVGDVVRQATARGIAWYDPGRGAMLVNAGKTGRVVGIGRTRVRVDFGRNKQSVFGQVDTDEAVIDRIEASMVTVIESPRTEEERAGE